MTNEGVYLLINRWNGHQGITDRLKTAVGVYYLARRSGLPFKLIHQAGFDLRDYLVPNEVPWSAETSEIHWVPWKTKWFTYRAPFDKLPKFTAGNQYLCHRFIGNNILEKTRVPQWEAVWRELFFELFKPSESVERALGQQHVSGPYAVVNARFVNSLGHREGTRFNGPLPPADQQRLIEAVLGRVEDCAEDSPVPIVVYSDSLRFLDAAKEHGFAICDPRGIGHIMERGVTEDIRMGTFTNFFQIAQAERVYSIRSIEGFPDTCLYTTQYPRYAAIVGDIPFIKVERTEMIHPSGF